jgi:hypothetical protein
MINIVKPLVWVTDPAISYSKISQHKEYLVVPQHNRTYTARFDVKDETESDNLCLCQWHKNDIPTLDEAMRICQEHYEKSILDNLSAEAKEILEQFNSTDDEE